MTKKKKSIRKLKGEHCLNVYISTELKLRLSELCRKYDRTSADMVRSLLKIGIPMMEGLSRAEEELVTEYVALFKRMRQVKALKDI